MPLCETGMPAQAGPPSAEVTPGTTSKGIPSRFSASISSPPRPNMNGSPPLSRATRRPLFASRTMISSISRCGTERPPPVLPTFIFSAEGGIIASTPSPTSRS